MNTARKLLRSFVASHDATTVTEYAVMLALIVLVAVGAISGIGATVSNTFATLETGVRGAAPL